MDFQGIEFDFEESQLLQFSTCMDAVASYSCKDGDDDCLSDNVCAVGEFKDASLLDDDTGAIGGSHHVGLVANNEDEDEEADETQINEETYGNLYSNNNSFLRFLLLILLQHCLLFCFCLLAGQILRDIWLLGLA